MLENLYRVKNFSCLHNAGGGLPTSRECLGISDRHSSTQDKKNEGQVFRLYLRGIRLDSGSHWRPSPALPVRQ
jgi:hypothetical protein